MEQKILKKTARQAGFTLIEVMIVVVIVAILASIAYPSYQSYIRKARRADAKTMVLRVQVEQEKYRGNNVSYSTDFSSASTGLKLASGTTAVTTLTSSDGYYDITLTEPAGATTYSADGTGYTIKATAKTGTSQVKDTGCTTLYLRSGDHISSTYPEKSPTDCW